MHSIQPTNKKYLPKMKELQSLVNNRRIPLLVLGFVLVLAAGLSGLVYPSSYSPLIFSGGALVAIIICLYFWKPKLALYTALFVVLLPAGLIPQGYQSLLNRFMTVLAFVVWCFDLIFRRRKVILTTSSILMFSFIMWGGVSIFWAENISSAITTIQMYVMRLMLFLILIPNQIHTRKDLNGLLRTLAFVGWILIISSTLTILQQGYIAGTRFKLLEENENAIGTLALIASLGVLWLAIQQSQANRFAINVLTFVYIIFMISLIGISGSRGSMLSLLIALFAFSYWRSTRHWARLGLSIAVIILIVAPSTFLTTFERFTDSSSDNLTQLGGRTVLWQAAGQVILDHPLGGVGIGGSSYAILPYLWMVSVATGRDSVSIHNPILTVWSELGIPGILLYLGVMACAVKSFINQYYRYKKLNIRREFISYYSLLASIFLGYMASWVKGGGAETDHMYFLLLALLLIPSTLDIHEVIQKDNDSVQAVYPNAA
jgi:O-antigen ligase